jgi:hypothetical protein
MTLTKIKLILISLTLTLSFICDAALLVEGTTIPVKLSQNINANMDITGTTVYFSVTEDVFVEDVLLIKEGEFVKGFISEAVGRKSLGKGGQLTITPKSLKTSNNQLVKFEQNPLASEGRKRTGATVAHVVMWGPLGLFAKGRAAFIMRGTEFDLTVESDVDLKPFNNTFVQEQERTIIDAQFEEYSKKINFRKGKVGKDFLFLIPASDLENKSINNKDIQIVSVNDDILPKPINPKQLTFNNKKNRYEAEFDFSDVVSYINPGSAEMIINIGSDYKTETSLSTEWKIK